MAVAVAAACSAHPSDVVAQRNYDPKTVETIEGKVLSVEKTASKGRGYGVHLTLQTDKETVSGARGTRVLYTDKQTPHIEANDTITVTGSRVTIRT